MRNYFKHVDRIMGHYSTGTTGGELMAKLREEKRCHRRALTMARDEERDELDPSKHYYPRDRVWQWRRSEEEDETSSSSDQGEPFDSLLGLPRRRDAVLQGRGARGRSLQAAGLGRRGIRGRGRGHMDNYMDNYSQSDNSSDSSEPPQQRNEIESDTDSSNFGVQ